MNRKLKTALLSIGAFGIVATTTACSTVNTGPDAMALHYSGGSFESMKFVECVPVSTRTVEGPGEHYFYYPVGDRTYEFTKSDTRGGDTAPLQVNTKDTQQMKVAGFVSFKLDPTMVKMDNGKMDCPAIHEFHDSIGYKKKAYFEGNPDVAEIGVEGTEKGRQNPDSAEWRAFLDTYVGVPLNNTMDRNGQQHNWTDLYKNVASQDAFRAGVARDLPVAVNAALGSDTFFQVTGVTIETPVPSDAMLEALKATGVAQEQNNAQVEKNKVAKTKYASMQECKAAGLTESTCVTLKAMEDGKIQFVPQGSDIIIGQK